jgi:hypothetical protein
MKPRQFDIYIACPAYGGNGGISSIHPDIAQWMLDVHKACWQGEWHGDRIGRVMVDFHADTPITMVRNAIVQRAKAAGADVLIMVDSDQAPDIELGRDPQAKPFFQSSFDFLYQHYERGPVCVFAPYCGWPPNEAVHCFHWTNGETDGEPSDMQLTPVSRREALLMKGIHPSGAGPTGLIMYDLRCFDLYGPPHFDYEWKEDGLGCEHCGQPSPGPRAEKGSTEDVMATRDLSLAGAAKLGYNPLFCNWDSWAGHWKPKCVGKPKPILPDHVSGQMKAALLSGPSPVRHRIERVSFPIPNGSHV